MGCFVDGVFWKLLCVVMRLDFFVECGVGFFGFVFVCIRFAFFFCCLMVIGFLVVVFLVDIVGDLFVGVWV